MDDQKPNTPPKPPTPASPPSAPPSPSTVQTSPQNREESISTTDKKPSPPPTSQSPYPSTSSDNKSDDKPQSPPSPSSNSTPKPPLDSKPSSSSNTQPTTPPPPTSPSSSSSSSVAFKSTPGTPPKPSQSTTPSQNQSASNPVKPTSTMDNSANATSKSPNKPASSTSATPSTPPPGSSASTSHVISSNSNSSGKGKKIFVALLLILVLAIGGFATYWLLNNRSSFTFPWQGGGTDTPGGPVTLTYWGLWESDSIMQPIIDEYESQNFNVNIEYKQNSPTEYSIRLRNALENGEGPDLFRMHNTWTYMLAPHLSAMPDSIYTQAEYQSTFFPVAYQNLRIQTAEGDQIIAIPLMFDGLALFYNTDLLTEAGVSAPTDWISFQEVARAVTVRDPETDEIVTAGAAMGSTQGIEHWSDIVGLLLYQNRADPSNPTNQLAADALTFYSLFSYRYDTWNADWPSATEAFATGKLGMMFAPSWRVFDVLKIAEENNIDLDFKVAPVPQLPDTNVTWANYWAEAVSKDSPHQQEAWEFLKYMSQADTMRRMVELQAQERPFGEIPSRQDLAQEFANDPYMGPYVKQAPNARSFPLTSGTTDQHEGINDRIIEYYSAAVDSAARGTAPGGLLNRVAQGVQSVLRDYGLAN